MSNDHTLNADQIIWNFYPKRIVTGSKTASEGAITLRQKKKNNLAIFDSLPSSSVWLDLFVQTSVCTQKQLILAFNLVCTNTAWGHEFE